MFLICGYRQKMTHFWTWRRFRSGSFEFCLGEILFAFLQKSQFEYGPFFIWRLICHRTLLSLDHSGKDLSLKTVLDIYWSGKGESKCRFCEWYIASILLRLCNAYLLCRGSFHREAKKFNPLGHKIETGITLIMAASPPAMTLFLHANAVLGAIYKFETLFWMFHGLALLVTKLPIPCSLSSCGRNKLVV